MQTLYLAGPITGLTYETARRWRQDVDNRLSQVLDVRTGRHMFHVLDPMRGKEALAGTGKVLTATFTKDNDPFNNAEDREVDRDFFDTQRSDVILFNLEPDGVNPTRISIGTMFEMSWAKALRKFSVTIMTPGNIHEHLYTKKTSCVIVPNLEEALQYLQHNLNA